MKNKQSMKNGFGHRAVYCGLVILFVSISTLFAFMTYLQGNANYGVAMYLLCMSILAMFLGELLRRACLLAEELCHKRERYQGQWKVFAKVFSFKNQHFSNVALLLLLIFFAFGAAHFYSENKEAISSEEGRYFLLLFQNIAIVPIIGYLAGIKEPADVEKSELNERFNKNLADGLAWSYYFGYLKLVLPDLDKAVNRSCQELRVKLDPVKLLILLPKNCYCYDTLDQHDKRIEVYRNLPPKEKDQSGVYNRLYQQTVYKISITNEGLAEGEKMYKGDHYCLVQYATPLKSLYQMSMDPYAQLSEKERLNQVKLFYNKIKEILDRDPECQGKYELIPLADAHEDLAMTIVKHIKNSPVDIAH